MLTNLLQHRLHGGHSASALRQNGKAQKVQALEVAMTIGRSPAIHYHINHMVQPGEVIKERSHEIPSLFYTNACAVIYLNSYAQLPQSSNWKSDRRRPSNYNIEPTLPPTLAVAQPQLTLASNF